jgi:hypothetical protein
MSPSRQKRSTWAGNNRTPASKLPSQNQTASRVQVVRGGRKTLRVSNE